MIRFIRELDPASDPDEHLPESEFRNRRRARGEHRIRGAEGTGPEALFTARIRRGSREIAKGGYTR